MASSESSVTLLGTVIKQLSSSGDEKSREFEKKKIQLDLKNADEKLREFVEGNQEHLKKTIQSFGSVATRVIASRQRIQILKDKVVRCKKLLHCNRNDLKTHWQEGLECTEKLNLLDKIEKAISVPEQLDRFMSRKHFLNATKLLVETVENLDGNLSKVEALRDLKASLTLRKVVLHETIIDELNKQIYAEPQKNKRNVAADSNAAAFKRVFTNAEQTMKIETEIPIYKDDELYEDLQKNPEENIPLFMYLMVESLLHLNKISEAVDSFKEKSKRDMMLVVRKITDQVAKRAIEMGDVVTIEKLAVKNNPNILLDLIEIAFEKFRNIATNHCILLMALEQAQAKMPTQKANELQLYTKEDIWSKIQFAIRDMLHPYLDDQNLSSAQQSLSTFGTSEGVSSFFTARKRLGAVSNKAKRSQLFKFECSSSAEALHSYLIEQDIATSISEDTYADFLVWNVPQLLCKPDANNITAMFIPVMKFIEEIDVKTSSTLGSEGVLHNFVTEFIEKIFIDQKANEVVNKANAVTKGNDFLRNLCDTTTQKDLFLDRPLLKSTIVVYQIIEDLLALMKKLPSYSNNFLEIINRTLRQYFDVCNTAYKGMVFREGEGKTSIIVSANWVRDEDIRRLLMTLPNWTKLETAGTYSKFEDEEDVDLKVVRDEEDKETSLLISNLEKQEIEKNQVIMDPLDLKSLANLQQSLDWLWSHVKTFITNVTAQSTGVIISGENESESIITGTILSQDQMKILSEVADDLKDLSESILLLLHLEVRVHCFFYIGKATRESSYVCNMDSMEVDVQIPLLSKDLKDIEDICASSLSSKKLRYLFHGLGYLMACIIISSTSYIKKINRNGVKKMCQNIFTIQQELANITTRREWNLDLARQYFELLYLSPDEILSMINEQGIRFKEQDYANAIELLSKSEVPYNDTMWKVRRNKLSEILREKELEGKLI